MVKGLKRLMTRVAKGELTMDEALKIVGKPKKTSLQDSKRVKSTTLTKNHNQQKTNPGKGDADGSGSPAKPQSRAKFKTNKREVK